MQKKELITIIDPILDKTYHTPRLGNFSDPMDELIYITLCTRTGQNQVTRIFKNIKKIFPTWDDILADQNNLLEGYFKTTQSSAENAKKIKAILEYIFDHQGNLNLSQLKIMDQQEAFSWLDDIPHVGPKIANCVLLFACGKDVMPVDTHIQRIFRRIGIFSYETNLTDDNNQVQNLIPKGRCLALHSNLIMHGRKVCRAYRPSCNKCVISNYCSYAGNHVID